MKIVSTHNKSYVKLKYVLSIIIIINLKRIKPRDNFVQTIKPIVIKCVQLMSNLDTICITYYIKRNLFIGYCAF